MNSRQSPSRFPQVLVNIVALAWALALSVLATTLPLAGRTTAEISDSFDIRFVPAGYVFSIWSLIYLALIGFAVFQAWPGRQDNRLVQATGWWFAVSSAANGLWIIFWHYGYYPLSLAAMLVLLASLVAVYRRLAAVPGHHDAASRWLVRFPFSLYLGWITVATIANASAVLVWIGWDGRPLTPVAWTVALIAVAAALALTMAYRHRDLTYGAVIVWALVGLVVEQQAYDAIVAAGLVAVVAIVAGAAAFQLRRPVTAVEVAR